MDDMKARQQDHSQLAHRIRPYLICLQQLEPVYVLAGWVLKLFLSILNRSTGPADATGAEHKVELPPVADVNGGNSDESGFSFFLRTLPSSPLNADQIAQFPMSASLDLK